MIVKLREAPTTLAAPQSTRSAGAREGLPDSLEQIGRRFGLREVRWLLAASREPLPAVARAAPGSERAGLDRVLVLELDSQADVEEAAAVYAADPAIEYAQPDYRVRSHLTPNDPFFGSSGSWGQLERDLWGLVNLALPPAWDVSLGEGVLVAVVDTGLDFTHPDIASNAWVNPGEDLDSSGAQEPADLNGVDDDGNGFVDDVRGFDFAYSLDRNGDGDFEDLGDVNDPDPFDDHGHGTHVSGTIAAVADNGLGIVGVAPRARIMAVKGFDQGGGGLTSELAPAIVYAAENGASVINNSWGCTLPCPSDPVIEDAVRLANARGAVVVFSAGNEATDVAQFSPQNTGEALVVAATRPDDSPAPFSNFGTAVDVAAPGAGFEEPPPAFAPASNVLSLRARGRFDPGLVVAEQYVRLAGTSMAAAHVSGLVALVRAHRPQFTNREVREALRLTAEDVHAEGPDQRTGAGRPNAVQALALERVPDVMLEITTPGAGERRSQRELRLDVAGTASGADFRDYQLAFGAGRDPAQWVEITGPTSTPVASGVLGEWPLAGLANGSYTLRLSATARSGERFERTAHVQLEVAPPLQVSRGPFANIGAAVAGDVIVWWEQEIGRLLSGDVFLFDPARGLPQVVSSVALIERDPSISGNLVVWDQFVSNRSIDLYFCEYDPATGTCPPRPLVSNFDLQENAQISGRRVVWEDNRLPSFAVFTCLLDPASGSCPPQPLTFPPGQQIAPDIDGERIVWVHEDGPKAEIRLCDLDAATGDCPARTVSQETGQPSLPAVSGDLVVWQEFPRVLLCDYDAALGACARLLDLAPGATAYAPAVDGDRVAWTEEIPGGIFFCEYDRRRGVCPRQALDREGADRFEPALDGNRIAWSEQVGRLPRFRQIFTIELLDLAPIGDQAAQEGAPLSLPVLATDPGGGPVELSATRADGRPLAEIGAAFADLGDGRGVFSWTPSFDQAGAHDVTFTARDVGAFVSQETIRIDVANMNRPPVADAGRNRIVRGARQVVLDGCRSFDPDGDALSFTWTDFSGRVLGTSCRIALTPARRPVVQLFQLVVGDGFLSDADRVAVLRLPALPKRPH